MATNGHPGTIGLIFLGVERCEEVIPCAAMNETSLNCRKMSILKPTGR